MSELRRFRWEDPDYERAFATLLASSGERPHVHAYLRGICRRYPAEALAVDWGAGGGDLTRLLLEHFRHVLAVEPSPVFRARLAADCPGAEVVAGTLGTTVPPRPVDIGIISHVLYHIPDHKWAASVLRAARQLSDDGVLLVLLKDPDSGCNRMLEHFGAARFNLVEGLWPVMAMDGGFNYALDRVPGSFVTHRLEDTLAIARLALCDRDQDAFSRPVSEEDFVDYVRRHFWDETSGRGGWHYDVLICALRRRPAPPAERA